MTELLPCPFCGEKRISLNDTHPDGYRYGSINCPACLVVMPGEVASQDELIGCWNTRPPSPAEPKWTNDLHDELVEGHLVLDRLGAPREFDDGAGLLSDLSIAQRIKELSSPSVPDHYAALIQFAEFIRDGYARGDINHVDYRVGAYKAALDVLAAVGGSRE